jgi:DNA-directed RNA polymerase I, II, and III subunit RPABC1
MEVIRNTLKEMLVDRGLKGDFEPAKSLDNTKMFVFDNLLIVFSTKSRVTEKDLMTFVEHAKENNITNGVLVVTLSKPSETVLSALRSFVADRANPLLQMFESRHLQFNISKHRKVPKHRIITSDEEALVLKEFNIADPSFLPKIDSQDAMAKWIGARPGNIVEITGLCETSAQNRRYRFCIADVTNG